MKWLQLAWRNVVRNRRRALITMLICAVGVASILIGGGFANFTYEGLREMAARDSGHLVLAHKDFFDKDEEMPMQYGIADHQQLARDIAKDRGVRHVLPRIEFSGLVSNGDKSNVFIGSGVDPAGEFKVKGPFLTLVEGRVLSPREPKDDPHAVIGEGMARSLNVKTGDFLTLISTTTEGGLNALDITIQGIMTTGVPEMDNRTLFVNINTAQDLLQTDKVSTLSVYLRDTQTTDAYHALLSAEFSNLAWQTWLDKAFYYLGVKGIYDRIFGLLGLIILVMVFFSISNTVSMNVIERTREIGTLRALGSFPAEINRGFMLEGLLIGALGSLAGLLIAGVTSISLAFAELQMPPPPGRSDGYPLAIDIPPILYLLATVLCVFVSMFAAWLAARKASSRSIVEALSHV